MSTPALVRPVVLVVDDDPANLRVFQRVFRQAYTILMAESGADALALLEHTPADVAFVDYSMPRMNGVALLEELSRKRPGVARYLLTGYGELAEMSSLRNRGLCRGVLGKPWERADIEAAVAECMEEGRRLATQ
jgi:two-component system response regulator (stage 0 sporulation protein F)